MPKDYLAIIQRDNQVLETFQFYDEEAAAVYAQGGAKQYECQGLVVHIKTKYDFSNDLMPSARLVEDTKDPMAKMLEAIENSSVYLKSNLLLSKMKCLSRRLEKK